MNEATVARLRQRAKSWHTGDDIRGQDFDDVLSLIGTLRPTERYTRAHGEQPEPAPVSVVEHDPGAEFWWARKWNGSDC